MTEHEEPAERGSGRTVTFEHIKSALFRNIHADGAHFGITPNGISLAFYSERQPIPKRVVYAISEEGNAGEEIRSLREGKDSIVRDCDVVITMNLETARRFLLAFNQMLEQVNQIAQAKQEGHL